jgi:hypothetical protein
MDPVVGRVYRWSASHGKGGKHCVLMIVGEDDRFGSRPVLKCLVIDGNHVPGYGEVFPGCVKILGWRYLNEMKRVV